MYIFIIRYAFVQYTHRTGQSKTVATEDSQARQEFQISSIHDQIFGLHCNLHASPLVQEEEVTADIIPLLASEKASSSKLKLEGPIMKHTEQSSAKASCHGI